MPCKVSVIIPVYNAERHLAACIESLLRQTLQACEFIFIDDGSTDGSAAVIDSYRSSDARIRLIRQANRGVSMARNAGMAMAKGEYVGFVDADDYVEPDMYERLYASADGCDVVISNMESEIEGRSVVTRYPFAADMPLDRAYIHTVILPYLLAGDQLHSSVNKLYRRQVLSEGGIGFPENVALGEDGRFNMLFFCSAASMKYIDYTGYHYREVEGSATRSVAGRDYFGRALEAFREEPPPLYRDIMSAGRIRRLKSVRLVHTTISFIYMYFKPDNGMSFRQKYGCVKRMIANPDVREALPAYSEERNGSMNRYEKSLIVLIRARSAFGLMCAAAYSRFRSG